MTTPNDANKNRYRAALIVATGMTVVAVLMVGLTVAVVQDSSMKIQQKDQTIENQKDEVFGFYNMEYNYCKEKVPGDLQFSTSNTTKTDNQIITDISCIDQYGVHRFTQTFDYTENILDKVKPQKEGPLRPTPVTEGGLD